MYNLIDILFFAVVAFFIAIKLYSILGQKSEINKAIPIQKGLNKDDQEKEIILNKELSDEDKIKSFDSSFSKQNFINRASSAIKHIYEAYGDGDTEILSDLLNIETLRKFAYCISRIEEADIKYSVSVVKVTNASVDATEVKNFLANIQISSKLQLIYYLQKDGKIIYGHKNKVEDIQLTVSYSKNLRSPDPTWKICKINYIPFQEYLKNG